MTWVFKNSYSVHCTKIASKQGIRVQLIVFRVRIKVKGTHKKNENIMTIALKNSYVYIVLK